MSSRKPVQSVTRMHGMPEARYTFVPQPVMGKTAEQLRAYVDGKSPISGRPVMQEVIEGLTRPLKATASRKPRSRARRPGCGADSEDNLHRLFLDNNWTDKLPIVLPTEERVEEMLAHTSRKPDEIVGHMRATQFREHWEFTVEKVAVNAVMAGAKPEYFPVILAIAASGVSARGSTTSSMAAMVVVNGPIRNEIGMNSGTGAMGPYNHANATIGRAFGLLSQNLQGGSMPGDSYMGSQGNGYAYASLTFAENEERSPWSRSTSSTDSKPSESTVSMFTGCRPTAFTLGLRETYWREHVRNMLRGMDPHNAPTFLLDPIAARQYHRSRRLRHQGKTDRVGLRERAHAGGRVLGLPADSELHLPARDLRRGALASKLQAAPDEMIPMFNPDEIHVVVVGGETNGYWRIMGCSYQKTVSVDEWR